LLKKQRLKSTISLRMSIVMSISLCGFYGKNNYGDDLMADCLSQRLGVNGTQVNIYSDNSKNNVKNGLKDDSFLESDKIVIGGGNIIGPNFWIFKDEIFDKIKTRDDIVFLNVGVTKDYLSDSNFVNKLQQLNAQWWVRDIESQALLSFNGINSFFLPDISLTLRDKFIGTKEEKTLGVLLNAYPMNDLFSNNVYLYQRAHQFARLLASHLDWMASFGWKIKFLPCHVSTMIDDRIIAGVVLGYMTNKKASTWCVDSLDWQSLFREINTCNLVFSMRYHASTTAVTCGTPFVDLVHHDKNKQFIKQMKMENCAVNIWNANHEELIEATIEAEKINTESWSQCQLAEKLWAEFDKSWKTTLEKK
jgi:polysaccharide pyruvyl transferase WcaK-like protein